MTVYEMLEMCNDACSIRIRIFDCNSDEIIFDSNLLTIGKNPVREIYLSNIRERKVWSYDLYLDEEAIVLEINIDYDNEEE